MNELDETDPLAVVVNDFVRRYRRGESPSIGEYTARHPELSDSIRRTLSAALLLEKVKSDALSPQSGERWARSAAPPQQLGDFRLLREIGRGGMGVVYEAEQQTLGRRVAVKVLYDAALGRSALQRFTREARAAARLHHTNIVPIFAVGQHDAIHYYAMQFIEGHGLDALIASWARTTGERADRRPRYHQAASIALQIAEALAYAHENGVLHRDVKPSNLMLDVHGTVWLTDFGLAKLDEQGDLTRAHDMLGTLRYMAPERLVGRCDARSDLFAAGLVLYELLTLRPARGATQRHELISEIGAAASPQPRQIDPGIPADLETIALKAMSPDPADRYGAAAELAYDLRCFLDGRPIQARRIGALERLRRWSRRNPALAAVTGLLVFLSIAVTVGSAITAAQFHRLADRESRAGRDAHTAQRSAEAALAQVYPTDGLGAARRGNNGEAALWFAHAAALSAPDSPARALNSIRSRLFARGALTPTAGFVISDPQVHDLRFDPSGLYLLIEGATTRQIWSLADERALRLPVDAVHIGCVAWDPKGTTLALGAADGNVSIWGFPDLRPQGAIHLQGPVACLEFSRDGRYLAVGAGRQVQVWDRTNTAIVGPALAQPGDVSLVRFSGNSDHLLTATVSGVVHLYPLPSTSTKPPLSVQAVVPETTAALVDDGKQLVMAEARSLVWRDVDSGRELRRIALAAEADWLACAASSKRILVGAGDQIAAFDAGTGRQICSVPNYRRGARCAAIDADGSVLLSGSADRQPVLWDLASGTQLPVGLAALGPLRSACFAPGGQSFAAVSQDGLVRVWALPAGPLPGSRIAVGGQDVSMRLDRGGRYALPTAVCSGFGTLAVTRVIDLASGKPAGAGIEPGGTITAADFSPDGRHVATASDSNHSASLQFWDWKSGKRTGGPTALPGPADGLCYNSSGSSVAILSAAGRVLIVRAADGSVACTWPCPPSKGAGKLVRGGGIRFSADDRWVLTWGNAQIEVREAATGLLRYAPLRHDDVCGDVCFSPGASYLATAGWDKTVRIWDFATGRPVSAPLVHGDAVHQVQFVADGQQLLTGCMDGIFRLWDWRSGQLAYPPTRDDEVAMSATATPDGRWLLIDSGQRTMRVWDRASGTIVSPALPVSAACWAIEVSSNGRFAVATGLGAYAHVFQLDDLYATSPPDLSDMIGWCQIISGYRLESGQLVRLTADQWLHLWRQHRSGRHAY